ncbi:MAG: TIGR02147 family protein, partial [Proteobacteria bacterium]
ELKFSPLDEDHFASVSDWYHDAILELTQVSGFKSNARWIATKLGVSVVEVNDAISRLVRLKHLDVSVEPWRDLSSSNSLVYSQVGSSAAVRKYQRQLLKISSDSIEGIAPFDRSHTSIVFALPRERIAQAEKIIREYRRKMVQLLKSEDVQCATDGPTSKNPDSIYALQISLFPLSKEIRS